MPSCYGEMVWRVMREANALDSMRLPRRNMRIHGTDAVDARRGGTGARCTSRDRIAAIRGVPHGWRHPLKDILGELFVCT